MFFLLKSCRFHTKTDVFLLKSRRFHTKTDVFLLKSRRFHTNTDVLFMQKQSTPRSFMISQRPCRAGRKWPEVSHHIDTASESEGYQEWTKIRPTTILSSSEAEP